MRDNIIDTQDGERLQKALSRLGVASRRKGEEMILAGRIAVNGQIVDELGSKVTPSDIISVDGEPIEMTPKKVYILLHKPAGWITSVSDPRGRRTVMDLLTDVEERVYPVGRLDYATSGLLLMTNDGEMTNDLLHPSKEVEKVYVAEVDGFLTTDDLEQLRKGVSLKDGLTAPAKAVLLRETNRGSLVKITIHEGRYRQVRRMLVALDYEVIHLKRVGFACMQLGDLPLGKWRYLTEEEIASLRKLTSGKALSRQIHKEFISK
ncbi:MAG: pseudouridine synthase [Clostridiales bacterium]